MKKINNKGFAVSGILYPILILTVFLIIQILTMMASRKTVLDKNKQQLLDSVNTSNKIYTNEELSILISEQAQLIADLQSTSNNRLNALEQNQLKHQKSYKISKYINRANVGNTKIKISNALGVMAVDIKFVGDYSHINYGGLVHYTMGTIRGSAANTCYGTGSTMTKAGELANYISSINVDCSSANATYLNINMTCPTNSDEKGSELMAFVTLYLNREITDNITVEFVA